MNKPDPYADIEKVPLFATDQMRSRAYSVRIVDKREETGWNEVGIVGEDYLLVPNRQVRDMALEIAGRSSMKWQENKVFFDGKRFVYALEAEPDGMAEEVKPGDVLSIGMLFENSYDGSRKLGVNLFVNRIVCRNGLIAPQYFARMRFKHDSSSAGWEDEVAGALSILGHADVSLKQFSDGARRLNERNLGSGELQEIRRNVLGKLPVTLWGKMTDRYLLHEEHTGWGLLCAGTYICWHNKKGSIQDFSHDEAITSGMIEYASKTNGKV